MTNQPIITELVPTTLMKVEVKEPSLFQLQACQSLLIQIVSSSKMATGLEAVGAAATLISIIGFSAQVFDGCVKGFVLLSTARNLDRDADILRSMLDWEQFRLEQWAEKASLQDPAKADILMDWKLITATLQHIESLTNDTKVLKEQYNLVLVDGAPALDKNPAAQGDDKASMSRFKRLFGQSDRDSSTAAARVIQSKNSAQKKLWWAAFDKNNMQRLIDDIAHFVQRLHDLLNLSIQAQMQKSIDLLLYEATLRYDDVPDLEVLRELAVRARFDDPPGYDRSEEDEIAEEVEKRFKSLLFHSVRKGEADQVRLLLDKGVDVHSKDFCGWPPLVRAAEAGQLDVAELLLKRGADPLKGTIGDRLPLHFAAEGGHEPVAQLLLQQPAVDPNKKDYTGQTALFRAAKEGHHSVVKLLLQQEGTAPDAMSDDGFTPLLVAVYSENGKVVQLLLDRPDVDPNQQDLLYKQTPLWRASIVGVDILRMFLKRKDVRLNDPGRWGETPFHRTIQHGRLLEAQMLLDADADPNSPNDEAQTPLSWAAAEGNEDALEFLLKQAAIALEIPDKLGQTPLSRASSKGHIRILRSLLAEGANVESTDKEGRTSLSLAALNGHKIAAKLLLKNRARVNVQDHKGNTPLALAAKNNHDAVVRFLLEAGADPELPDEGEETPFEKARDHHLDQIVALFREHRLHTRFDLSDSKLDSS